MRLNKNTARRAAAAAALLTMTAAMSVGAFAADDTVVAGYLPPQAESVMTQGDIALHSDVPVGEVDQLRRLRLPGGESHSGQRHDDLRRSGGKARGPLYRQGSAGQAGALYRPSGGPGADAGRSG